MPLAHCDFEAFLAPRAVPQLFQSAHVIKLQLFPRDNILSVKPEESRPRIQNVALHSFTVQGFSDEILSSISLCSPVPEDLDLSQPLSYVSVIVPIPIQLAIF